jgi:hypothetical protein
MNNPPAFPDWTKDGMTLRDYMAAKAMPAILEQMDVCNGRDLTNSAWIAYQMADAMLKAREV